MALEKVRISNTQFMYAVACFTQGSTILTSFISNLTRQDTWLVLLASMCLLVPIVALYGSLAKKYPGKNLLEIFSVVYGPVLGKFFSLLYCFFFFTVTALNIRDVGDFVAGYVLTETPLAVILVLFLLCSAYAVKKGLETVTRYGFLLLLTSALVFLINSVLLVNQMKPCHFLPILSYDAPTYLHGIHTVLAIPLCETVFFLMITPNVADNKKLTRSYILGALIGSFLLFLVAVRDTAVMGDLGRYFTVPSYEVIRLIEVANILTRMEILFAFVATIMFFFKITVLFYISVLSLAQLLNLRAYRPIVTVVGALLLVYALNAFLTSSQNVQWGPNGATLFNTLFELVIPLLTWILSFFRKDRTERKDAS